MKAETSGKNSDNKAFPSIATSFVAGLCAAACFAPLEYWWLMPFCLAILIHNWLHASARIALLQGYAFGFGLYIAGVYWIFVLAHSFNNAPVFIATLILIVTALLLASYIAVIGYLQARVSCSTHTKIVLICALWVLSEWLRGHIISTFPWLDLGYSQTTHWLSGYAPLGGVNLVSFALLYVSGHITVFCKVYDRNGWKKALSEKGTLTAIIAPCLFGAGLNQINWSQATSNNISVAIVQANIPIELKWDEQHLDSIVKKYYALTKDLDVDLAIWPETAIPSQLSRIRPDFWQKAKPQNGELISGIAELHQTGATMNAYNSAIFTCNNDMQLYRKQQLVPFGEYLPYSSITDPIAKHFEFNIDNYTSWEQQQTLSCNNNNISLSICFELAFSNLIRQRSGNAGILINISEDAWTGNSTATYQRLQLAQMRAQELARPMLTSSNTGPSAIIDHKGKILSISQPFTEHILQNDIHLRVKATPFQKAGSWINYVSIILISLIIAISRRGKAHPEHLKDFGR
ncbi:MAG: apolipoprotein N-acyltransferase [Arenicella sp.]